jgi:hypothetical protein
MFPLVVVFGNVRWNFGFGQSRKVAAVAEQDRSEGEAGNVFEDIGVLDCFRD